MGRILTKHLILLTILTVWLNVLDSIKAGTLAKRNAGEVEPGKQGCRSCPPGSGVLTLCNSTHDTTCQPCLPGTFNSDYTVDNICYACSICPEGYYERTPCIETQDVACAQCYNGKNGFGNEDFLRKCETTTVSTTTPLPSTTTGKPREVKDDDEDDISGSGEVPEDIEYLLPVKTTLGKSTITTTSSTSSSQGSTPPIIRGLGPVPTIKYSTVSKDDNDTIPVLLAGADSPDGPMVGEAKAGDMEEVDNSSFQWPVLVAAITAGIVFFVVGMLVSMMVHKGRQQHKPNARKDPDEDAAVRTTMITPRIEEPVEFRFPDDQTDSRTPIILGKDSY